jgi:hypothetical protein
LRGACRTRLCGLEVGMAESAQTPSPLSLQHADHDDSSQQGFYCLEKAKLRLELAAVQGPLHVPTTQIYLL